jgi:hypothetical protein
MNEAPDRILLRFSTSLLDPFERFSRPEGWRPGRLHSENVGEAFTGFSNAKAGLLLGCVGS